jgi:APA family basic amino acid/polyamine antiporter
MVVERESDAGGSGRRLGFTQAVAIGLGNIIGAGIFVMAGSAINASGPGALVAFLITAGLAITVGLNTAELSAKYPHVEGGVYSFAKETLGDTMGFLIGWFRLISYAVSGAAVALGFAGYMVAAGAPSYLYFPAAVALILVLSYIVVNGLRLASRLEVGLVAVKIVGLAVFVAAVFMLGSYKPVNFSPMFPNGGLGVLEAANIAFFAYSGFNTISTLTPDVENGEKTVPRAIITSIVVSALLYVLVVFSLLFALDWRSYGSVSNPLSLALVSVNAPSGISYAVDFAALAATFAVTLSLIIAAQRTTKQMGEDRLLPKSFGKGSKVPTVVVSAIMIASLGLGNVQSIALVANFGIIFSYMLSGVEVAIARRKKKDGKFRSPAYPLTQIISVVLSIIMLLVLGSQSLMLGVATLMIGLTLHSIHGWLHVKPNHEQQPK